MVWGAALPLLVLSHLPCEAVKLLSCFFNKPQQLFASFFSAFLNIEVLSSSIYCASIVIPTIITIICSHVGLGGYDGVRQHRGADREGRGEAHPLGWFMVLLTAAICLSACSDSNSSAGPACRTVGGWRGMLIDFYSNLFFVGVTQYAIILRYIHYECMTELLRHTPIVFL